MTYVESDSDPSADRPKLQRRWEFDDPGAVASRARWRRRAGIGAIVVAVGLLVWGWLEATAERRMQGRAFAAAVEADLTRLRAVQLDFFEANGHYATLEDLGPRYITSQGVRVRVHAADSSGWHATGWHLQRRGRCTISGGSGPAAQPELTPGVPDCR